jgi:superfamily II DNA helicase RecQ
MIFIPQTFQLLIAPPAWGKTRLFQSWLAENEARFLLVAPLRALATEIQASCPRAWVALPEELRALDWEALARERPDLVVVWDEVHLVYEWGLSFRHALLEAWYGFCVSGLAGVGLTATLTGEVELFLRDTLRENHHHLLTGDAGNFLFKHRPTGWCWAPRPWVEELLREKLPGRTLIFCRHRQEVDRWCARFSARGIRAWGCKGGETREFSRRLGTEAPPDVIVATSCLSHGVNLPALDRVVLLDRQAPAWMVHQMRTRAGRRGEAFEVWTTWGVASVPLRHRPRALLRACARVMMNRARTHLSAWCHGP